MGRPAKELMKKTRTKVLLVEDDVDYHLIINRHLKHGFAHEFMTLAVKSFDAAMIALNNPHVDEENGPQFNTENGLPLKFDVVLLDLHLPDFIGMDRIAFMAESFPDTPIIVLTSLDDETVAQTALKHGAQDYLFKNELKPDVLRRSIRYGMSRKSVEKELRDNQQKLQAANQELKEFAYRVSHDLRAPLRAINHLTDWIIEDAGDSVPVETQTHIQELKRKANRLNALVEDLLEYAQVGSVNLEPEQIHFAELIEEVTSFLDIPGRFDIKVTTPELVFAALKKPLQVVFRNLIDNAIKHHNKEEGIITVSGSNEEELLSFTVQDDGPGIAPEFHNKIFEMFGRIKSKDDIEGSGIGLSVVSKTIEHNGGLLYLESEEGKGARFTFTWKKVY